MSERKYIATRLTTLSPYELEGKLSDVIDSLQQYMSYKNVRMETINWYDDPTEFAIIYDRLETDGEFQTRIAKEQQDFDFKPPLLVTVLVAAAFYGGIIQFVIHILDKARV